MLFSDTSDSWAKNYISSAYPAGIIEDYNKRPFGPNEVHSFNSMRGYRTFTSINI